MRPSSRPIEPRLGLLVRRISELDDRLRAASADDPSVYQDALSELALAIEEVHVVGEELALHQEELQARSDLAEADHRRERDLFDHAPTALLATDRRGWVEQANHAAAALLGRPADQLCGHSLTTFFSQDDKRELLRLASRVRRSVVVSGTVDAFLPTGERLPVEVRVTGSSPSAPDPARLRWSLHDLSAFVAHEAELQASIDELNQARAGQEAFLLGVAHDLRGPVSTIRTLVDATLAVDASADTLRATLQQIGENAHALGRIQTDLVDLERLARNAVRPYRRPVDLSALVLEEAKAVDLGGRSLSTKVEPVVAEVDPGMLRSMVRKLVDNAVAHTPPTTSITVRLAEVGDGVRLVVEDDGPGVAEVDRARVFDLFWRGGGGRRSGLGAGLHLVRRFAELHGGSAVVTPSARGGARVEVSLRRGA